MDPYTIRAAVLGDSAVIAGHRVAMFSDMGMVPTDALAAELFATSQRVLERLLQTQAYVGWLAVATQGGIIGGAGAHVKSQLPRVARDGGRVDAMPVPLVVNVYTEPAWRGQGIARALMKTLLEWAQGQGCDRVLLHASDAGRRLYVSLGFEPTNEMSWTPGR